MARYVARLFEMDDVFSMLRWLVAGIIGVWGQVPELTQLLIWLMVIDLIMGIVLSFRGRKFDPSVAWKGVTRKLGSLVLIGVMALLEPQARRVLEVDLVQAASAFYIVPELGSIVRNAALLDVPVPDQLNGLMDYFRSMSGTNKKEGQDG